jgi:hypothetical protein
MPRPPPPRPPPPLSTQSVACNNANESIGGDDNNLARLHGNENGDHASTPIRHHRHHDSSNKSSNTTTARIESSPLRAAANLIQSLDIAHTEMKSLAGSAAADAENARRNARTAQEIARRYQNRSYPTFKMDALDASASNFTTTTTSSSFSITPRPKPPEMMRFDDNRDGDCFENDNNNNNKLSDTAEESSTTSIDEKLPTDDFPRTASNKIVSSSSSSSRNVDPIRGVFYSPTSSERIAQHHADDVLQLSLELEQTKQALKSEQLLHQNCQTSLSSIQSKTASLEKRNQKLLEDSEKERQQSTKQISDFEQELELSRLRLQAAEEDAQLALDLAKDSAEQRDEMEGYLHQAQEEIRNLKQQQGHIVVNREEGGSQQQQLVIVESPKRHVHFSSDTDIVQHEEKSSFEVSDTPRPSRSMITAGRQVLIRQRNMLASSSPRQDAIIRIDLTPTKSAERRQRLCQRLNEQLNESNDGTNITLFSSSSSPSRTPLSPNRSMDVMVEGTITNAATKKKLDEYHTATRILQISGKRLDLDGYWWREHSKTMPSNNPIQIDIMTRQYCQNVEFKIDRQQKDINQLESLCGYLEKKLVLDDEPSC